MGNQKHGWVKDVPDPNDYTFRHNQVAALIRKLQALQRTAQLLDQLPKHLRLQSLANPVAPAADSIVPTAEAASPGGGQDPIVPLIQALKTDIENIVDDLISGIDLISARPISTKEFEAEYPEYAAPSPTPPSEPQELEPKAKKAEPKKPEPAKPGSVRLSKQLHQMFPPFIEQELPTLIRRALGVESLNSADPNDQLFIQISNQIMRQLMPLYSYRGTLKSCLDYCNAKSSGEGFKASPPISNLSKVTSLSPFVPASLGDSRLSAEFEKLTDPTTLKSAARGVGRLADPDKMLTSAAKGIGRLADSAKTLASAAKEIGRLADSAEMLTRTDSLLDPIVKAAHLVEVLNQGLQRLNEQKGMPAPPIRQERIVRINVQTPSDIYSSEPAFPLRMPIEQSVVEEQLKSDQTQSQQYPYYDLALPEVVDLSYWCPKVKNQGNLNACTINAVASLVEYFQVKSFGKPTAFSTRFLYRAAKMMQDAGSTTAIFETQIRPYLYAEATLEISSRILTKRGLTDPGPSPDTANSATALYVSESLAKELQERKNIWFKPSLRVQPPSSTFPQNTHPALYIETPRYSVHCYFDHDPAAEGTVVKQQLRLKLYDKTSNKMLIVGGQAALVEHSWGYSITSFTAEGKPTSTIIRLGVTQKAASLVATELRTQSRQSPESLINALKPHVIEHQWEPFLETAFDAGASIRQSLKALKRFGMPPEQYWPNLSGISYDNTVLDQEPPPFCYAFMQDYQNVKYLRLDFLNVEQPEPDPVQQVNQSPLGPVPYQATQRPLKLDAKERGKLVLLQIKAALAAGFPAVFGFSYDPALENEKTGEIRFPSPEEAGQYLDPQKSLNHAVLAVGYDDERRAFLFQNSWGESWGTEGYGWLPYEYVLKGLATDWWTLLNEAWVETGNFGLDNRFGGRRQTPF